MKKILLIHLIALGGFWVLFFCFQQETIYRNTLGLVSKNWEYRDGERITGDQPFQQLNNQNFIQWDANHYYFIRNHGYDITKAGGDYIFAFFPLFPAIWRMSGLPPLGIFFLNFIFLAIALFLLLRLLSPEQDYSLNAVLCLSLPGLVIFFIPYTEAIYLLATTVGIYGLIKNRYGLFFGGFFLAALVRPSYIFLLLSIVGAEFFFFASHRQLRLLVRHTLQRIAPLLMGTGVVSVVQYLNGSGGPFTFMKVQKYWGNILSIPHNLRDWSQEGFGINLGVIFLLFIPLLVVGVQLFTDQWSKKRKPLLEYTNTKAYLLVLAAIYLIGVAVYTLLFRGGSLHGLFRYSICSPFIFVWLLTAFPYVKTISARYRFFTLTTLSLGCMLMLGLTDYAVSWNFSYAGLFMLMGVLALWLFQDFSASRLYQGIAFAVFGLNLVWTTYLFNMYLANGWIFT